MADGIDIGGTAGWRGNDMARAVTRIAATVRQDDRRETRQQWVGAVRETLAEAQPLVTQLAVSRLADAATLDAARDSIAAALAQADGVGAQLGAARGAMAGNLAGMAATTTIPLAPGASEDAVAAAQALAQLIAANARPALAGQARLDAHAVAAVAIEPQD